MDQMMTGKQKEKRKQHLQTRRINLQVTGQKKDSGVIINTEKHEILRVAGRIIRFIAKIFNSNKLKREIIINFIIFFQ